MTNGFTKQSLLSISINTSYAVLLAVCFFTATNYVFRLASTKELFATKDQSGEVIVRSYVQSYICGAIALSQQSHKIFDQSVQVDYTNRVISPLKTDKIIFSQYMPYLFTLMIPFATLDVANSFIVWTVFASAASAAGLWLLMENGERFTTMRRLCFLIGCAGSLPYLLNVFFGQLSPLIVGLVCVYYWGWLKRRDMLAGFCLALSTLKPQYAVFAALPSLAQKRFRLLAAAAVSELLLLVLAGLNVGWENVIGYPQMLLKADTSAKYLGVFPDKMVCLRGPLSCFLPQQIVMPICLVAMVIALGSLFWLWVKTDRDKPEQAAWAMAITMLAAMIFSPHTHIYDCLFLVLPAVLTLKTTSLTANILTKPPAFRLWTYMILLYPIISWGLYLTLVKVGNWSDYWALIYNCVLIIIAIKQWFMIKGVGAN